MKIKKVDDKPMVIHTKKKAKIHSHEPKTSAIKGAKRHGCRYQSKEDCNYYDILAVYMVKYGVGETATIMNDMSKGWLKSVVDDMCTYTTSIGEETEIVTNEDFDSAFRQI